MSEVLERSATTIVGGPKRKGFGFWATMLLLIGFSAFYLMPLYVMIVNGLKDNSYMTVADMWSLPQDTSAWDFGLPGTPSTSNLINSFKIAIPATIGSALIGAINGYLLSKWKFRGSDMVFTVLLFGMFIPYQSILIPMIQLLQRMELYGHWYGLVVVHIIYGIPITTLIFRNYFSNVPSELVEAARIDGAGVMGVFWQIMLPLSMPAFVVVGIFQFTNIWNDFLFASTVVFDPANQPVTVALNNLSGTTSVDWTGVMGGAVLAALPTMIVYVLLGRYFIKGLLSGSMKG